MATLRAAIEVPGPTHEESALPWPIAERPAYSWMTLDGRSSPDDVGLFVTALQYGAWLDPDPTVAIDALLSEDRLVVAGGLVLAEGDVTVGPGCCCGLESWREWWGLPDGAEPWLGHDPSPMFEDTPTGWRVWQHDDRAAGTSVDLGRAEIEGLLRGVESDMRGLVQAVGAWTVALGVERGAELVEAISQDLQVVRST